MNQLYPIVRRARRPLLPVDEVEGRLPQVPSPAPSQGLAELAPPKEVLPPLVKVDEAFSDAEKRKGKASGKAAA